MRKRWDEKVSVFRQRGISVKGFEDQLALYIALLVETEQTMKAGLPTSAAHLNQLRQFAVDFYDNPRATDAGKHGPRARDKGQGNPFAQRGVRPKPVE